ncbi:porin [Oleisolibacter albus]|uniref:porin n=1 Tax=Oleisolibacter albus TaxID=2171757 RepID=UPI00138FBC1D|nr:porin [Oleisolibacter albus]
MRRSPLPTLSLLPAPLVPVLLLAVPILMPRPALAAEQDFTWQAVGQLGGVYTTDPARGGDRWSGYAGYGVTGDWSITTDSGLVYGLSGTLGSGDYEKSLDRPGTNSKFTLSEGYVYVTSAWGRLKLGDEDGAAKRAVDLLPTLVGGEMDGFWTRIAGAAPPTGPLGRDSDDATKILYETPRLMGLRAGLSWSGERKSLVEEIRKASDLPAEENLWEFGLNYRGDVRAWSYELAAGYVLGDSQTPGIEDTRSLKLAGLVYYGGFSLGAVWSDDGDSARLDGHDTDGLTVQGTYENGPYGLTLFWNDSRTRRELDYTAYGLGLSWRVREHLTLGVDGVRYDADRKDGGADGKSWVGSLVAEVRY